MQDLLSGRGFRETFRSWCVGHQVLPGCDISDLCLPREWPCLLSFTLCGRFNDDERAAHDRVQFAMVRISTGSQGRNGKAAVGWDGDGLKGAQVLRQAPIMANAVSRSR